MKTLGLRPDGDRIVSWSDTGDIAGLTTAGSGFVSINNHDAVRGTFAIKTLQNMATTLSCAGTRLVVNADIIDGGAIAS